MRCPCHELPQHECPRLTPAQSQAAYRQALTARAAEVDEQKAVNVPVRMSRAGVPDYAAKALLAPRQTPAVAAAKKFETDGSLLFLLLLGDKGLGKTVAAAHVLAHYAARYPWNTQPSGPSVEPMLFIAAREVTTVPAWEAANGTLMDTVKRTPMLVVDDMGQEGTTVGRDLLVNALFDRHAKGKRTVLTSNLRTDAFKARYGDALADRIRETGLVVPCVGQSMRERRAS